MNRLKEALGEESSKLQQDAVVKRFEFTFESLWKALKMIAEEQGIQSRSPREALQAGFKLGLIEDDQACVGMLEDKNLTSHLYDEVTAQKIFERIKSKHVNVLQQVFKKISQKN